MSEEATLHKKYRPPVLDKIIGHDAAVTSLRGTIKSGKIPSAILFHGPSSAGKTTLARAYACAVNGVEHPDKLGTSYIEINCTDKRTIDDVRSIIQHSRFKSALKKRVIVLDEFQGLLSNPQAAAALLKPLEDASPSTLWVLCTMDPSKLSTGNGKAIANRCEQFSLSAPSEESLTTYVKRILKGEKMKYAQSNKIVERIVAQSNFEYRTAANLVQKLQNYAQGLDKLPEKLKSSHVESVFSSAQSSDEDLAVKVLLSVYAGKYRDVMRSLLDVQEGVRFIQLLLDGNSFLLNLQVLQGEKHPGIQWWRQSNRKLAEQTKPMKLTLGQLGQTNERLVETKALINNFTVTPQEALSAKLYLLIKDLFTKK